MKKIITLLFIATAAIINVQASGLDPVTKVVTSSFNKQFSTVKDVNWSWVKEQDMYKATFNYNNKQLNAYFTREGEFVGTSRYVSNDQLPLILSKKIAERYTGYEVRTVIEFTSVSETSYFITIEGEKLGYILKGIPNGDITQYKKIKKFVEN